MYNIRARGDTSFALVNAEWMKILFEKASTKSLSQKKMKLRAKWKDLTQVIMFPIKKIILAFLWYFPLGEDKYIFWKKNSDEN